MYFITLPSFTDYIFIDSLNISGSYILTINCVHNNYNGVNAVFALSSNGNGKSSVMRIANNKGDNEEQLNIEWGMLKKTLS